MEKNKSLYGLGNLLESPDEQSKREFLMPGTGVMLVYGFQVKHDH